MRCDLFDDNGKMIDVPIDQEVEFRFNLMLDSLEDWKQVTNQKQHETSSLSGGSFYFLFANMSISREYSLFNTTL